jgi:hypothetical protein
MKKNIIFYFVYLLLFGCSSPAKLRSPKAIDQRDLIEIAIEKATPMINKLLKAGNVSLRNKRIFYLTNSQLSNDYDSVNCALFEKHLGYDYIQKNILFSAPSVSAMIVDVNNKYVATCSPFALIKDLSTYKFYSFGNKIIDLCKENNYISFVEISSCRRINYIGYKKGKVDVYRLVDSNLVFVYSK